MAESNATILIPDISGFTEFITATELEHGSHAINLLLNSIIEAVGNEYEISEIEGDAVLMFKRGTAPTKKDLLNICLKIFNAFHYQRKWMQQHAVCPCGACQAIINLTLKFVAHHGRVGEMKVGRFVTLSGKDVIIAHRLLKNSVPSHEYLLITKDSLQDSPDSSEHLEMDWSDLYDEFASIGKVDYVFTHLEKARKQTPNPPPVENYHTTDNASFFEIDIKANYRDVYMVVMNIPGRAGWLPGLQKVEQEQPAVYVGSQHHCIFENYSADLSPVQMKITDEGIFYAEECKINDTDTSLVYEYIFKKIDNANTSFTCRLLNKQGSSLPKEMYNKLFEQMKQMTEKLKSVCESLEKSFFSN